jgi:transposase
MNARIILGVDGGSKTHRCRAINEKKKTVWQQSISNDHSGCNQVLEQLKTWTNEGSEIWVAGEGHGGYLSPLDLQLLKAGYRYVNLSTVQLSRYREMVGLPPDKDDDKDALHLAELLHWKIEHQIEVQLLERDEYFEHLKESARGLNQLVKSKVALQNQLVGHVRRYWPELIITEPLFSRTDAKGLLAMLKTYPTPEAVAHAGLHRVKILLQKSNGNCRSDELATKLIHQAQRLRFRVQVTSNQATLVQQLATSLLELATVIHRMENDLTSQLNSHPFGRWLLQQPGIGPRTAGGFLGEAGNLNRFKSERQLARYAGNGAVKNQSGIRKAQYRDNKCYNHRLKRAVLLMAQSRYIHHGPSKKFVLDRKQQQIEHWRIIKKLSRHLIRFLWKGWQECMRESESLESATSNQNMT